MIEPQRLDERIRAAIKHFWATRQSQSKRQAASATQRDVGARSAVTGGAQLDGFVSLVRELLIESGVPDSAIHFNKQTEIPGWFRAEKAWDLPVLTDRHLYAAVEFKSQVGPSFGNNFNNRTEEALGSATDVLAAFREGAFAPSARPWLGYLMLLEDTERSRREIQPAQPHFPVLHDFAAASYARRYELLILKLLRERLYDGGCLLLTKSDGRTDGNYTEPNAELSFRAFLEPLLARTLVAFR